MGALTIKSNVYETRSWELDRIPFVNLLTTFPDFLILFFKNTIVVRILPLNRNSFISNTLRFSTRFFTNLFSFKRKNTKIDMNFFWLLIEIYSLMKTCTVRLLVSSSSYSYYITNFCALNLGFFYVNTKKMFDCFSNNKFWIECLINNCIKDLVCCFSDECSYFVLNHHFIQNHSDFVSYLRLNRARYTDEEIAVSYEQSVVGSTNLPDPEVDHNPFIMLSDLSELFLMDLNFLYFCLNFKISHIRDFFVFFFVFGLPDFFDVIKSYIPLQFQEIQEIGTMKNMDFAVVNSFGFLQTNKIN